MKASLTIFGIISLFTFSSRSFAMPEVSQVMPDRASKSILAGALSGGEARDEFSLIAVKDKVESAGEKIALSYGTPLGQPLHGMPGFFHIQVDHGSRRIVIDLAQVARTAVDPSQLQKELSRSKLVASSDMTMDPQDGSTNITLNLKAPASVSVLTESKSGQLILDLHPKMESK